MKARISPLVALILSGTFLTSCVSVPHGQIRKHSTPGHIQQATGYNPASGKFKPDHMGKGKGKGQGKGKKAGW